MTTPAQDKDYQEWQAQQAAKSEAVRENDDAVRDGDDVTVTKASDDRGNRPSGRASGIVQRDTDKATDVEVAKNRETLPWDRDDAPKGSTPSSLLTTDENGKTVVSGPTHYTHLANGRIVPTFGIGTSFTDADENDGEPVPVVAHY